ncbi:MAG: histidine phosphotransferase family protein [Pseudomonadota bacterium]
MTVHEHPNDLELAALIASKICHDVIGPVGAIYNGLEILAEDDSVDTQSYALEVIRNVTEQASARLQFARFAFGASGSAGSTIDLNQAREISDGYVKAIKHTLTWSGLAGQMSKNRVKLLLNLIAMGVAALPRGGEIAVEIDGTLEQPTFRLTCTGKGAREPSFLNTLLAGEAHDVIDSMSVQAYYTWRLSTAAGMTIAISSPDDGVVQLTAE